MAADQKAPVQYSDWQRSGTRHTIACAADKDAGATARLFALVTGYRGKAEVTSYLLEIQKLAVAGADVNARLESWGNKTPLHFAISGLADVEEMRKVISTFKFLGADLNVRGLDGQSPAESNVSLLPRDTDKVMSAFRAEGADVPPVSLVDRIAKGIRGAFTRVAHRRQDERKPVPQRKAGQDHTL